MTGSGSDLGARAGIGVGVIGTGVMGADHVRTLRRVSGAQLTAVSDLDTERAREALETAGWRGDPPIAPEPRVVTEPQDLVADPSVDAVVVASADHTHEELVSACLRAGKPVLCEKPLTPDPEGASRIVEAEQHQPRRLVTVGFMRRYDPGYLAMARTIETGELGVPLMLHNIHRNAGSRAHAPSSALLKGSAVHEFDVVRWLSGQEIAEVTVHRPRPSPQVVGDTQDPVVLVLRTTGGLVATIEVFVNARYGYDVRCELVAEHGSLSVDMPTELTVRRERQATRTVATDWRDRFAEAYRCQLQDWTDGIRAGQQRGATAWDGYTGTVVAAAAIEALRTGRTVRPELAGRPAFYAGV